jgi:DNA-binding CsgD family transcriptional regulator
MIERNRNQSHFPGNPDNPLTPKEIEILRMVAAGYSNSRISQELFVSLPTVKSHIYTIYRKINAPNRVQAVLWALKNLSHRPVK